MADNEVKLVLESWGLEELVTPFSDAGIDFEIFQFINHEFVKSIVPFGTKPATLFKFWHNYAKFDFQKEMPKSPLNNLQFGVTNDLDADPHQIPETTAQNTETFVSPKNGKNKII